MFKYDSVLVNGPNEGNVWFVICGEYAVASFAIRSDAESDCAMRNDKAIGMDLNARYAVAEISDGEEVRK